LRADQVPGHIQQAELGRLQEQLQGLVARHSPRISKGIGSHPGQFMIRGTPHYGQSGDLSGVRHGLSFEPIGQVVQARTPGTIDGCMTGLKRLFRVRQYVTIHLPERPLRTPPLVTFRFEAGSQE